MNRNGAENPQNPANPRQAGHNFRGEILHHCIFLPVMAILGWLVQLKYTSATASPFVTDYVTIRMFIVAFLVYFGFLAVEILLAHAPNSDMGQFINNITFLFGTLASILLLLILVRAFGLFALLLWTIYLVRDVVTKKSYRNAACDVFNRVKEMISGHLVEINAGQHQPQPPPQTVVQIEDEGEPNVP